MSITTRIILSFVLMALATYVLLINPWIDRVERQYLEAAEEPMVDVAHILAGVFSSQLLGSQIQPVDSLTVGMIEAKARQFEAKIYNLKKKAVVMDFYVTNALGVVLYDSGSATRVGDVLMGRRDVYLTLQGQYGARSTRMDEEDPTSSVMYVGAPILHEGKVVGVLSVYKPQRSLLFFIEETKRRLLFWWLLALSVFLLLGYLLSKWVTYPLRRLTEYAAAVSRGERLAVPQMPGRHLRLLGETTETMREVLENRKYVESYVQSMTHEMKSPVAGILGSAELLYEDLPEEKRNQFVDNIQSESKRLQSLIDQLLALSSIESRKALGSPTLISLSAVVRRVVNHYQSKSKEKAVRLHVHTVDDDWVLGEEFLLETAVSNLVQNAIDYSSSGACVDVRVTVLGKEVVLQVTDEGEGIPAFAVDRVFDRFYSLPRPGSDRKSSGLGLCFVQEAVVLHQGSVTVSNREEGSGVLAELRLPGQGG